MFFGGKGGQIQTSSFDPQNTLPWPEQRIMTYFACVKRCDCSHDEEGKKETFHETNWLFAQTTYIIIIITIIIIIIIIIIYC